MPNFNKKTNGGKPTDTKAATKQQKKPVSKAPAKKEPTESKKA
jgi:hypothetical protein